MENKLKRLFDFQKFAGEPHLDRVIKETEERMAKGLTDEELEFAVAGKGESEIRYAANKDACPLGKFGKTADNATKRTKCTACVHCEFGGMGKAYCNL